jgi:hypothetical protein
MVTCEASGAREHGHDSKHEASSGRTNNARKGVDESVGARGQGSHGREMTVLEANRAREGHATTQAGRPRPAGLP